MRRAATVMAILVAAAWPLAPRLARADAIDGNWCSPEGKHFAIKGPTIVTGEGHRAEGDYRRHTFAYTIPAEEPSAGRPVFMVLIDETTLRLRVGAEESSPWQVWRRCDVTS